MGCADVCLDMGYDGYNEFYAEKMVTARKAHTCCECDDQIPPGSTYQRATGKFEGDIFSYATCASCAEIRTAFTCGTWVFEGLWEAIEEEIFPIWHEAGPWDCLAKLTTDAGRAKANAKYREWLKDRSDAGADTDA